MTTTSKAANISVFYKVENVINESVKKSGPRIDPCGNPRTNLHHSLQRLFISNLRNRSNK